MIRLAWAWWRACEWLHVKVSKLRNRAWQRAVNLEMARREVDGERNL